VPVLKAANSINEILDRYTLIGAFVMMHFESINPFPPGGNKGGDNYKAASTPLAIGITAN
jgi:hypothetical protein